MGKGRGLKLDWLAGAWALVAPAAWAAGAPAADHWPMVEQYCVNCHNTTDWAGQLALDAVDHSHAAIPADAETWEKVIKRLRGRLMPPPGEKRPLNEQLDSFVHWLESAIDESAAKRVEPGYVPLHRLNRREYTNAIRDLLDPTVAGKPALLRALRESADAMEALFRMACERDGHLPATRRYVWRNLALDVGHLLTYFVAHEAHHRGQLLLVARQLGMPVEKAAADHVWWWKPAKSAPRKQRS